MVLRGATRAILALVVIVVCAAGCEREQNTPRPQVENPSARGVPAASAVRATLPPPAATVAVADEATGGQLVEGFYALENGAWRWTGKHFAVDLGVPANARQNGATLRLKFTVTPAMLKGHPTLAISGKLGEFKVPAQHFNKAGTFELASSVPASALQTDRVRAEFFLDGSFRPGGADIRELGLIAHSVALEARRP